MDAFSSSIVCQPLSAVIRPVLIIFAFLCVCVFVDARGSISSCCLDLLPLDYIIHHYKFIRVNSFISSLFLTRLSWLKCHINIIFLSKWRWSQDITHHGAASIKQQVKETMPLKTICCEAGASASLRFHNTLALTWELMMRMVVLFPTSLSYPSVGAALKRRTASWESERWKAPSDWRQVTSQPRAETLNWEPCKTQQLI